MTLLDRVRNDRYSIDEHPGDVFVRSSCAASRHIERLIEDELRKPCLMASLRELRDAPAIDMRLRHAMILGADCDGFAPFDSQDACPTTPAVAQEAGTLFDLGGEG